MNPFDMMKNLAGMQSQFKAVQEKLAELEAEGSSGGNMVRITINGKFEIVDIKLDPICVDNRDVPMLQDLIRAAHHAALEKMQEEIKAQLGPIMAGINIPGMGA
ncbi:YbaB/EbfC family nucleoid-associated protein [Treponema sp.]|uniref:YbaB/EbfC family nucleoid-associated protein n=1 Tax=Treponema sp. TaxID=166 RepID=UPI003F0DE27C